MARLLVLRGETLEREIEVGRQTFRIGRGEQNDLVLEDPGKAVSRNHAEIRYEGGRYDDCIEDLEDALTIAEQEGIEDAVLVLSEVLNI